MEKLKIKSFQAYDFVKNALTLLGYPKETEILCFVNENKMPCYQLFYEKEFRGLKDKHLTNLSKRDFLGLMILGMTLKGYSVANINLEVYENEIRYEADVSVADFEEGLKRNKRRK